MRQRNIKNIDEKLEVLGKYLVKEPEKGKGKWKEKFSFDGDIYLEIGCGKGQFITELAERNPENIYLGVEGQANVMIRGLEKAKEKQLENVLFINAFVNDANDFFEEGEIEKIYLNFSDPWPKERHRKRRLTHRERLETYFDVLSKDGNIEFKTDNDGLFAFTMNEIKEQEYEILEMTNDLAASEYESKNTTTEYEDRFKLKGKNINYVKFKK